MARQGHVLETVAINELKARRERLVELADAGPLRGRRQLRPRDDGAQPRRRPRPMMRG